MSSHIYINICQKPLLCFVDKGIGSDLRSVNSPEMSYCVTQYFIIVVHNSMIAVRETVGALESYVRF